MNKVLGISLVMVAMLAVSASFAAADPHMPRVEKREARQQMRIEQGLRSGQLTPREAARLENGQARVDRAENRVERDGHVSWRERERLSRMQDRQSRHIYRFKHNARRDK